MTQSLWLKKVRQAQVPKRCIIAQPHELTRLRALVEPVTQRPQKTGSRSGRVTAVTPRVDYDEDGWQTIASRHEQPRASNRGLNY